MSFYFGEGVFWEPRKLPPQNKEMKEKGIYLLIFFTFLSCVEKERIEGPRIRFVSTSYDFGYISQQFEVVHFFKFKNIGSDTLLIKNVRSP